MKIVYLHGFASSPSSKKARAFRERFERLGLELSVPDLGGDFENLTVTAQLHTLDRVVAGQPCSLIGSSMGGYVAALYAARHKHVSKVILMAPAFEFSRRWRDWLGPAVFDEWERTGLREVFHYGRNAMLPLRFTLITDARQYEDYPDVSQPCLIFHGIHDHSVPIELSRRFAHARPNVTLLEEDSDHELLNVVDSMFDRVRRFLEPRPPV